MECGRSAENISAPDASGDSSSSNCAPWARFRAPDFTTVDGGAPAPPWRRASSATAPRPSSAARTAARDERLSKELAYFLWELVQPEAQGTAADLDVAVGQVLGSESNHLALIWDAAPGPQRLLMLALSEELTAGPDVADYHRRHELPANPTLQRAPDALIGKEIAARVPPGEYRIIEPFLADWLTREQACRDA